MRRAGSRGTARQPRRCVQRCGRGVPRRRGGARCGASARGRPTRSSTSRTPRWTWPSSTPSRVGRNDGPRSSSRTRPTSWSSAAPRRRSRTQPGMELRRLTAERRDPDGVLEQTPRVPVMAVRPRGGEQAHPVADLARPEDVEDDCSQRLGRDLGREELEEALELVGVATHRRRQLGRIRRRPPRPPAPAPGDDRRTAPRARGSARRRLPRSAGRAARRRPTRDLRSAHSGRRARRRGTAFRFASRASACARPRRRRRRCDPRRAPRSSPRAESRAPPQGSGRLAPWPTFARFAPSATRVRARR